MIVKILLIISCIYIFIGMIGIFKFKNLYSRLLSSSTIDTVASLTILIALMVHIKEANFILRIILIIIFILITSPISSHLIIRSAVMSGIKVQKEDKSNNELSH